MRNYRSQDIDKIAELFKALSNPNRLRVFLRLATCCAPGTVCTASSEISACVGEIGSELDISPSTLSHHLKELRRAGLIKTERRGQNIACSVDPDTLRALAEFFPRTFET